MYITVKFSCSMPRSTSKTKPVSLRLSTEVRERVQKLGDDTGLIQAQIYDLILRAGCRAIAEENDQISIPLKFQIVKK